MAHRTAPSWSTFTLKWIYDVFLSFRGEDTRQKFTGNLYNSLCEKGVHTFIDDEGLRRGEEITPALLNAIQNSRIAIVVFSKNYASSTFCLDKLVKILECLKEEKGRSVFPIFYDVDPSHVRHQKGTYSEALAKHEERFPDDSDKVQKWRKALYEAANLSGWHFQHGELEYKSIRKIVKEVYKRISCIPLHIADNPIGLEHAVLEVKSLLGHGSDVNIIGIYGIGGIGKTTISRAVYNLICSQFEGTCFLLDIREKAINKQGLVQLQEMLLSEVLKKKHIKVGDVNRGIPIIKRRLEKKKVLLVLDDVDKLEQLKVLAGESRWFGNGSIIIITTRDKHLLATHGVVKIYDVKPLNVAKALELFNWCAFKNHKADPLYVNIANRAVSYACGIPLALEVIGSHLFGKSLNECNSALEGEPWCSAKSLWAMGYECNSALDKYERIPHEKIHEILKVSYDGLEENEKQIFLDIACFFNTCGVGYVTSVLRAHGFHVKDGLRVLVDRSLLKIDASGCVRMHDLIRDTGREIVRQESTVEPGRRSRLWFEEDIVHVLEENTGTDKIEFIKLEGYNNIQVQWNGKALKEMKNLRILIIENTTFSTGPEHLPNSLRVLDWSCYPSPSLPADFNPKRVELLLMPESCLQIFQPYNMFESLSVLSIEDCQFLTDLPSLREVPLLAYLCIDNCTNLVKIDGSIGFLDKLQLLSAKRCSKLKILAPCVMLPSLEILDLRGCTCLDSFPEVLGKMENIKEIYLDETAIETLPCSIGNFVGLQLLSLRKCGRLHQLPGSICILPKVKVIFGFGHVVYRFWEENQYEQELSLEVSPRSMVVVDGDLDFTYIDMYYPHISPNNVIQVCSPNLLLHHDFILLFKKLASKDGSRCRKSSMHFSFRNKFPKIAVCCSVLPSLKITMILILKLGVLINGTKIFSSSCNYLFTQTWNPKLWCDLESKAEGMFSEQEWNEAEILFELGYPTPCAGLTMSLHNFAEGRLNWTLFGVYEEGNNKEDIKFKDPMSTFSFCNMLMEPPSSLPSCLYYVVK
ncbi:TMV resistance protein N [Glycine soja]|uniref:TMV resistance protein N n=1 Tax=Glycine soja TaxID=3848 RepID=A0A445LKV5_GLYSO|nr:TMV resistance protein N [Glycine soja]